MTPDHTAASIINRFLDWATDPDLLILDTETTGLRGEVIELGIIDNSGRVLFNERFKPTCPIEPGAQKVHGISMSDVQDQPEIGTRWPEIRDLLDGRRVLIYNAAFDLGRMSWSLDSTVPHWYVSESGEPIGSADMHAFNAFARRTECVMRQYAPLANRWDPFSRQYRWVRLATASADRGVDLSDLKKHSAVSDCEEVRRLILACAVLDPQDFYWIGQEGQSWKSQWMCK